MTSSATVGRRRRRWRTDILLALAVLAMAVPFLRDWSTQPASRYLYTVAVYEDHSFRLDPYARSLGLDYAVIDGHHYSDKAPYQPMAAVPAYALYRFLGGQAFPVDRAGVDVDTDADIGLWLVTVWSAAIPAALLMVLLHRHVARVYPDLAVKVPLALVFGTVLLPFSSLLFGHLLAALAGFAAWFLVRRPRPSAFALVAAGALLGAGIGVEYTQVVVAAVIGIAAIALLRARAGWVALGGLIGSIPLLVVNAATFGGPFKTAYQGYLPNFQGTGAFGVYNLVAPVPLEFGLALIGDRGLFSLTPVMILAVAGAAIAIRGRTPARIDAIVALVLLGLFLLVSTGIDGYGGDSPGPRYLVPVLAFFALPLAEAWRRWAALTAAMAIWSAFWMVLATITDPLYHRPGLAPLNWLGDLVRGDTARSMPMELVGRVGVVVPVVLALGCAIVALRTDPGSPPGGRSAAVTADTAPDERLAT